ncbi:hypothetical protein REPUB_Repub09cG0072300 [Reevesia pubescens]
MVVLEVILVWHSREVCFEMMREWLFGFTYKVGICSIITVELWVAYQRPRLCWERGYRQVEIETDS